MYNQIYIWNIVDSDLKQQWNKNIYTPMALAYDEAYENCGKYFPMKDTGHVTEKLTLVY